jgi:hypothetical protein
MIVAANKKWTQQKGVAYSTSLVSSMMPFSPQGMQLAPISKRVSQLAWNPEPGCNAQVLLFDISLVQQASASSLGRRGTLAATYKGTKRMGLWSQKKISRINGSKKVNLGNFTLAGTLAGVYRTMPTKRPNVLWPA